jgi:hypothetical protein
MSSVPQVEFHSHREKIKPVLFTHVTVTSSAFNDPFILSSSQRRTTDPLSSSLSHCQPTWRRLLRSPAEVSGSIHNVAMVTATMAIGEEFGTWGQRPA